jgi:hypothetical protein
MAIIGTNSTNIQIESTRTVATYLWALKTALLEAGWRLMSCGTGTGGSYTSPNQDGVTAVADPFTTPNDLNVSGAWIRIKEPGTTTVGREYILQRGDTSSKLNVKYSRATGFTSGSPNANTSPTTGNGGDGVSMFSTLSDSSTTAAATVTLGLPTTGYVQAVASDIADANGVWAFYVFCSAVGLTDAANLILYQEGLLNGSTHPLDQDPSYRGIGPALRTVYQFGTIDANIVTYWSLYGTANQTYRHSSTHDVGINALGSYNNRIQNSVSAGGVNAYPTGPGKSLSIYDGKVDLVPLPIGRTTSPGQTNMTYEFKGISSGIMTYMTAQNNYDVFDVTPTKSYISIRDCADGSATSTLQTIHSVAFPWVPGLLPLI